ncbi:glycosyltransferase family 4 protein [Dolichospermum circinale CS-539/09]|uniref:glycosyltransferase family 4 protein n=2 Tax=Dolichospermum circinale TaxID=109265 RepID=UPI00233018A0|nr:glycosyltransferase family 4 protein [Dolichospermum circinale]MDB9468389.1 glycosyltransferase family 4 protein [Dolichospermum circinale CS-539/09]
MKKISILTQYFYPSNAATAQLMTDLAKGLYEHNYNLNIFTGTKSNLDVPDFLTQFKIIRAFSPIKSSTSIFSKISSSIFFLLGAVAYVIFNLPGNVPLLIASNPPYAGILGILFNIVRRGKYYFLLQDIFPESAAMSGIMKQNSILYRFFSKLIYLTYKYSEYIIVLSTSMQEFLEKKYPDLKPKIKVIENWAIEDIPIVSKAENNFAQQHELDEIFTVLYSGNMGRLHDIETITEAAKILKDEPIKFVFIGDGAKTKIVKQAIENFQLKNILLLPYQPRELLPLSLTACDISLVSLIPGAELIVAPSKLYGMLSAGRGLISISVPNSYIDKLLTNSGCGVNVPPDNPQQLADIIRQLASDNQRVKSMGEISRQLYETRYTFKRALDEYEKLIFQI